jgi:osmotically-inducible protein OsmY
MRQRGERGYREDQSRQGRGEFPQGGRGASRRNADFSGQQRSGQDWEQQGRVQGEQFDEEYDEFQDFPRGEYERGGGDYGFSERGSQQGRYAQQPYDLDEGRVEFGYRRGGYGPTGQEFGGGQWQLRAGSDRGWEEFERSGQGRGQGSRFGQGSYGQGSSREQGRFGQRSYGQGSSREQGRFGQGQYGREGGHAGKGPKGYQRGDERIREDVCDCLTEDAQIDPSNIEVKVESCVVTLSGQVDDRQAKRLAEDIAESISGVREVRNELRVQPAAQGATGSQSGSDQPNKEQRQTR